MAFPAPLAADRFTKEMPSSTSDGEAELQHYRTIGDSLMIAEACCFRVGIPWLPPTAEVRSLVARYHGPLEEFIRLSLVTVPTKSLEAYCEDLDSAPFNAAGAQSLSLRFPSLLERYTICLLLFVTVFAVCGWVAALLGSTPQAAGITAVLCGTLVALMGGILCMESQRRCNFSALIGREILRRKGLDPENSNRLNLLSIET